MNVTKHSNSDPDSKWTLRRPSYTCKISRSWTCKKDAKDAKDSKDSKDTEDAKEKVILDAKDKGAIVAKHEGPEIVKHLQHD